MAAPAFSDCFSEQASNYARYRPSYPRALYAGLAGLVAERGLCWDCATGNGQAAVGLAGWFDRVVATDASALQLAHAVPHPRVEYRCELAERTSLADGSADLVTVAAALHWLDLPAFYAEVERVLRPGGVFAAWTYAARVECGPAVDAVVDRYQDEILGPFTRPELGHVATRYRELAFPFAEIPLPPIAIEVRWTLAQLVGLLDTWSSAGAFRSRRGHPATDLVLPELTAAWLADGPGDGPRPVGFPLYARVGRLTPR